MQSGRGGPGVGWWPLGGQHGHRNQTLLGRIILGSTIASVSAALLLVAVILLNGSGSIMNTTSMAEGGTTSVVHPGGPASELQAGDGKERSTGAKWPVRDSGISLIDVSHMSWSQTEKSVLDAAAVAKCSGPVQLTKCNPTFRDRQKKLWLEVLAMPARESGIACADIFDILALWRAVDPDPQKYFVDIGANRGYTAAYYYALWGDLARRRVHIIASGNFSNTCTGASEQPYVYVVEPVSSHRQALRSVDRRLFKGTHFVIAPYAVTDVDGKTDFTDASASGDDSKWGRHSHGQVTRVESRSLDGLLKTLDLDRVDFLKIDMSGSESAIFDNMKWTLTYRKIKMMVFKYGPDPLWEEKPLGARLELLDKYGFDCFFVTRQRLFKISGQCWDPVYEIRQPSTVLCVLRTHVLMEWLVTRFILTANRWDHPYDW